MSKILCIALFLAFAAYGQQKRIAIINTEDDGEPPVEYSELSHLTNKLRDIAVKTLPGKNYGVMTQQSIVAYLGSQESMVRKCKESRGCLAQLGREINADYICQGRLGRFGNDFTINVELYDVRSGILVGSLNGSSKDIYGLLSVLETHAPKLFGDMLPPDASPPEPAPAVKKECENRFNINELTYKIQSGFPSQLKDCSATLAKNMALAASPFGKKTEQKEPKAFMTECTIDGIKQKLPPGAGEYVKPVEAFAQNLLNAASAGGALDVKKLSGTIGGMNVNSLINELKAKAASDDCAVDEPYEPSATVASEDEEGGSDGEDGKSGIFYGFRGGMNFSHLSSSNGSYNSTPGFQLGLLLDWALSDLFHFQPGLMYIQKGAKDNNGIMASHYIEIPLLISFRSNVLSWFTVNAGPYFAICLDANTSHSSFDFGLSAGFGFDMGMFYIGMFYDYALTEFYGYNSPSGKNYELYNRTLGLNLGVNL